MSARSKGRRKLNINGGIYYWYVHDEIILRIYSEDKEFIVHYELMGENPLMVIHGKLFNAVTDKKRPIWVAPPLIESSFGPQFIKDLILWALKEQENLEVNYGVPEGPLQRFISENAL